MEGSGAHIVHDHVAGYVVIGFCCGYVSAFFTNDNGCFQFEIEFFEVVGHTGNFAWALDSVVVGEIEDGVLIEFGDHGNTAISAGGGDVLSEGIPIAATAGVGDGCKQGGSVNGGC